MSIIRAARRTNFAMIPRPCIEDDRLSWEARGLLSYLLSKPDHWRVMLTDLIRQTEHAIGKRAKRDKIYSILNELRAAGYLYRYFNREGGSFTGVEYEVSDTPDLEAGFQYALSLEEKEGSPFTDLPETAEPFTPNTERLDKTERAIKIEKAVKNTGHPEPPPATPVLPTAPSADRPGNYPKNPASPTYAVWHAYADAFVDRYGTWPLYNGTVGGKLGKLIERVGDRAAATAAYYVQHENAPGITSKCHPVGQLLQDCEGYATKVQLAQKSQKRAEQVKQSVETSVKTAPIPHLSPPTRKSIPPHKEVGDGFLSVLRSAVRLPVKRHSDERGIA